jgi:peptidoglycan/xylan/chitin deacetylase (PgdA/CDA1 family)
VRRLVKRLRRWLRQSDGPAILMYHRIAAPDLDPWGLSVSPKRFADQIQTLRARRTILSMDAFVAQLQSGDLPHDAVAFTFDDGYLDNLRRAKPILEAADIPATVFVTTGRIGTGKEFWWDELARMTLSRTEPLSTSVTVDDANELRIDLPAIDPETEPRATWRAWDRPATAREATYQTLWQALQGCAPGRREEAMAELRGLFGSTRANPEDLPMSAADVRRLVSRRISVGAHGCTHQLLTSLPAAARFEEIQRSRAEAQALSGLPVLGFAYPHGDRDAETIDMVRRAGYDWACSTCETTIDSRCADPHDLPRIAVGNWPANTLLVKLNADSGCREFL